MVREVGVDGRNNANIVRRDSADTPKEVDGALKAPCEQAGACQKQVSNARRCEIESGRRGSSSLQDFKVQMIEERANQFLLCGSDTVPKGRRPVDNAIPLRARIAASRLQSIVE